MCWNCLKSSKSANPGDCHDGADVDSKPARIVPITTSDRVTQPPRTSINLPQMKKAKEDGNNVPRSTKDEFTSLWKKAYDMLEPSLIKDLETLIKVDASIPAEADLKEQIATVVIAQKENMESKQWSFPWFKKTMKVKEVVDNMFSLINKSSGLISTGMSFAPIYVSIPWSAVSALIPLMMSDAKKHQEALQGLERVTKILWCYTVAEKAFFEDAHMRETYSQVLLPLYVELLKYQCIAAQYFGQNTLRRIWRNTTGSTTWSDNSAEIVVLDDDCRRAIQPLGFGRLQDLLNKQTQDLDSIISLAKRYRNEKEEILSWISTVPFGADHDNVRQNLGKLYQSSGRWIFQLPQFQDWQRSQSGIFVLRGTAGTGKSSLTSIVIQDLLENPNGYLAYFYCSRKEKASQRNDTTIIIRTLVKALSINGHPAFEEFSDNYRNSATQRAGGCQLQLDPCLSLLSKSLDDNPSKSVVIVIDAIDECAAPAALLSALSEIRGPDTGPRNVRIFFSSRDGPDVEVYFPTLIEVDLAQNNAADIKAYIETEIPNRRKLDRDSVMTDVQAWELQQVLLKYANGMFQWVVLEIEIFLSNVDDAKIAVKETIDKKINALKTSKLDPIDQLDEAYDQIYTAAIGKNDPDRKVIVDTALQWLLCAYRDLSIGELLIAASIKRDGTEYRSLKIRKLRNLLSNFMVEGPSGDTRLAHLTIRPYLEKRTANCQLRFEHTSSNLTAALTCLQIMHSVSCQEICATEDADSGSNSPNVESLKGYASIYWSSHCRAASKSESRPRQLQDLLESIYGALAAAPPGETSLWMPFHNAIRENQHDVIGYLIASNMSLEQKDRMGNTPLHEAVQCGDKGAVQLLLQGGAMVQAKNNVGNTALHLAGFLGKNDIIQTLLREEASPNELNFSGQAPIHMAVLHSRIDAVRAFISAGIDLDLRDLRQNTPLHFATLTNHETMMLLLIQAGCTMNPQNQDDNTPLHFATTYGSEGVIATLLRNGAKPDIANREGRLPCYENDLNIRPSIRSLFSEPQAVQVPSPDKDPAYSLEVESSILCSKCVNFAYWVNTAAQFMYHEHHSSYKALEQSGNGGCRLCRIILEAILAFGHSATKDELTENIGVKIVLCGNSKEDNIQDLLLVRMGTEVIASLELFIDKADEGILGKLISGRRIYGSFYAEECSTLVKQWLAECNSNHPTCRSRLVTNLPTRLINVGEEGISDPRLEFTSGQMGIYAWLSFIWGIQRPSVSTTSNLKSSMRGLPMKHLSKTIRDAIYLARELGIRYIWIDSLCIIQDDQHDWATEIPNMSSYITGAACTFVAVCSGDADGGLFYRCDDANPLISIKVKRITGQNSSGNGFIHLRKPLKAPQQSALDFVMRRAWMVGELILAQRVLFFHKDQLFWNCNNCLRSEGSIATMKPMLRISIEPTPATDLEIISKYNFIGPWYSLIELYSQTNLTYLHDRFPALSGVVYHLAPQIKGNYVAGIWSSDLLRGLLWRAQTKVSMMRPREYLAPSWSWTALVGSISYSFAMSVQPISTNIPHVDNAPNIIDISVTPESSKLPGCIAYGFLVLSAMSMSLSSVDPVNHSECFFDLLEYEKVFLEGQKDYTCVLLAQNLLDISDNGSRWIGLVLSADTSKNHANGFHRVGVFIGPGLDSSLSGWERKVFTIR